MVVVAPPAPDALTDLPANYRATLQVADQMLPVRVGDATHTRAGSRALDTAARRGPARPSTTACSRNRAGEGLTDLGVAAVRAMYRERMLIDVSHMRGDSIDETFALLDALDRESGAARPAIP